MKNFLFSTLLLVFLSFAGMSAKAQRQQFDGSAMRAADDTWMATGQALFSRNGNYRLSFQTDGNLVLYKFVGGNSCWKALWSSKTDNKNAARLRFQTDGNFVIYNDQNAPIWGAMTNGHSNAQISLQDDGNLVITEYGKPLWATGTH